LLFFYLLPEFLAPRADVLIISVSPAPALGSFYLEGLVPFALSNLR